MDDRLKYIQFQEGQSGSLQNKKIPFEIDAENVIISTGENDISDLQTEYNIIKDNHNVLKQSLFENDSTIIREDVLPKPLFLQEDKDKLDSLLKINVLPVKTQVTIGNSDVFQVAELKSLQDELKRIQTVLLAPPVIQADSVEKIFDKKKIYVYTGRDITQNDIVYKRGHWYYYAEGWKDGGIYAQTQLETNFNQQIADINTRINNINTKIKSIKKDQEDEADGFIDTINDNIEVINNGINTINNSINSINEDAIFFGDEEQVINNEQPVSGENEEQNTSRFYIFRNRDGEEKFRLQKAVVEGDNDIVIAEAYAVDAKKWAIGPNDSGSETATVTNNAKYYFQQSKKWAIGENESDTNNAKYWAGQAETVLNNKKIEIEEDLDEYTAEIKNEIESHEERARQWAEGQTVPIGGSNPSDTNNAKYYSNQSKKWAIGLNLPAEVAEDVSATIPSDDNNALHWALLAKDFYNNIRSNCVTSFGGKLGNLYPSDVPYTTQQVFRVEGLGRVTLESELDRIENNIDNNKVDKTTALLNLDISKTDDVPNNTEDYELYSAITALNWTNTIV